MHIDIALISTKRRVEHEGIELDDHGEIQIMVAAGAVLIPVRIVMMKNSTVRNGLPVSIDLLVITAEPALDPNLTARWIGTMPAGADWAKLPRKWDLSQQDWRCEVRKHRSSGSVDQ